MLPVYDVMCPVLRRPLVVAVGAAAPLLLPSLINNPPAGDIICCLNLHTEAKWPIVN